MKQKQFRRKTSIVLTVVCVLALGTAGCTWSKNLKACQEQNQALTQHIMELEYQLAEADKAAAAQTVLASQTQMVAENATYLVAEGDSLWSIASKQLGSGKRYKEILALNPQITKDTILAIGTTLKLPPK